MDISNSDMLKICNQQFKELSYLYKSTIYKFGISDNEFWILYTLITTDEDVTQRDICDLWSIPKQTVNTIIGNLAKKDLLYLTDISGTKKNKSIVLNNEGKKYAKRIVDPIRCVESKVLDSIDKTEIVKCLALFSKIIENLKKEMEKIELTTDFFEMEDMDNE